VTNIYPIQLVHFWQKIKFNFVILSGLIIVILLSFRLEVHLFSFLFTTSCFKKSVI
jgi:hypothetical protein